MQFETVNGGLTVHISLLSLVSCVLLAAAAGGMWCHNRRVERRRDSHRDEWARLSAELRDLDEALDQIWAAEQERVRRHH